MDISGRLSSKQALQNHAQNVNNMGRYRPISSNYNMESKTLKPIKSQEFASSAEALIAQAIDKNVPVESLERLLAMRRELRAEAAKEAYDQGMAAFQSECPTIERRKQGYNYKYAPLESIVEQVKESLSKNGFSYTFDTDNIENAVIVYCRVKHIAGHMETSKARIEHETTTKMNSSQQSGASMTYGKRYAFCNAFGILTGDEDTDAASTQDSSQIAPKPGKIDTYLATPKQINFIAKLLPQKGHTVNELLSKYEVTKIDDLTIEQASTIIANLSKLPDDVGQQIDMDEVDQAISHN